MPLCPTLCCAVKNRKSRDGMFFRLGTPALVALRICQTIEKRFWRRQTAFKLQMQGKVGLFLHQNISQTSGSANIFFMVLTEMCSLLSVRKNAFVICKGEPGVSAGDFEGSGLHQPAGAALKAIENS